MSQASSILVVDDDEATLEFIREALTDEDYRVATARDGAEALRAITSAPPALIILDVYMPGAEGWKLVRQYRQRTANPTALIVMTAAYDAQAVASEAGADGYLAKPFDLDELLGLVAQHAQRMSAPR